jgi:hypothetical protein
MDSALLARMFGARPTSDQALLGEAKTSAHSRSQLHLLCSAMGPLYRLWSQFEAAVPVSVMVWCCRIKARSWPQFVKLQSMQLSMRRPKQTSLQVTYHWARDSISLSASSPPLQRSSPPCMQKKRAKRAIPQLDTSSNASWGPSKIALSGSPAP